MPRDLTYGHVDTDGTMAGNSDKKVSSQKALKTYVDTQVATKEATLTKGRIIGVSPMTASNNSGSVIGADVTVSIATLGIIIGAANQITVSDNSGSVIGGNVTVSLVSSPIVDSIVATTSVRIATSCTITTSTTSGVTGTIAWDSSNLYICTATDTWVKTTLSSW